MIFKHPFTAIVAGPSGSGKTVFTAKLIEHSSRMIDPPPQKILWCYGAYQKFFNEMKNVEFHDGLPDVNSFDGSERTLLILDDLMRSHHKNLSVLYLTQNLFCSVNRSKDYKY